MPKLLSDNETAGNRDKAVFHSDRPTLTNRGSAGLLKKLTDEDKKRIVGDKAQVLRVEGEGKKNNIRVSGDVVSIASLVADPMNARLHPERNLKAIRESLVLYGQLKALVVRPHNRVVVAGNGTLEVAKSLGWTEIAVNFVEMTDAEAMGFGLADNKSAELAKWDFEAVARLDKMMQESEHPVVGWTDDEIEVLRMAEWKAPEFTGLDRFADETSKLTVKFSSKQGELIRQVCAMVKDDPRLRGADEADCIEEVCKQWLEGRTDSVETTTERNGDATN